MWHMQVASSSILQYAGLHIRSPSPNAEEQVVSVEYEDLPATQMVYYLGGAGALLLTGWSDASSVSPCLTIIWT